LGSAPLTDAVVCSSATVYARSPRASAATIWFSYDWQLENCSPSASKIGSISPRPRVPVDDPAWRRAATDLRGGAPAVLDQGLPGDLDRRDRRRGRARSLRLHARNLGWVMQRVVPLLRALETAAAVDEDAAVLWADLRRQRRIGTASVAANLAAKTTLRCEERVLADMLFTLPPDACYRLVYEEGWSVEAFQGWLADLLQRVCLP
jgi:hypothetical protein